MISICIPSYEQHSYGHIMLEKLFKSIEIQSFKDFEVIVSDNSDDREVARLCDGWRNKFDLKYSPWNKRGISNNTNHAIEQANYGIIKPMFQDDIFFHEKSLEKFVGGMKYGWIASDSFWIDKNDDVIRYFHSQPITKLSTYNYIGMPSVVMFRKNLVRFDARLTTMADVFFYHELEKSLGAPTIIPEPLVGQRIWDGSFSSQNVGNAYDELYEINNRK